MKRYYNPLNKEYVVIEQSSEASDGAYSLLLVTLEKGGHNPLHFHTKFVEEFVAVSGVLGLQVEQDILYLQPKEAKVILPNTLHCFFNPSDEPISFRVKLTPGQPNFENFIKVLFGLVRDGKTTKQQYPFNVFYSAILFYWSDTQMDNLLFKISSKCVLPLYWLALRMRIDRRLLEKYE